MPLRGGGGGRPPNGKCHLKFPFWLFEPFPYVHSFSLVKTQILCQQPLNVFEFFRWPWNLYVGESSALFKHNKEGWNVTRMQWSKNISFHQDDNERIVIARDVTSWPECCWLDQCWSSSTSLKDWKGESSFFCNFYLFFVCNVYNLPFQIILCLHCLPLQIIFFSKLGLSEGKEEQLVELTRKFTKLMEERKVNCKCEINIPCSWAV